MGEGGLIYVLVDWSERAVRARSVFPFPVLSALSAVPVEAKPTVTERRALSTGHGNTDSIYFV